MKRYFKEIIILILQIFAFYVGPLFAGPTEAIAMVFMLLLSSFLLSFVIGIVSQERIKYFYPIIASAVFIPTVPIYYNESALAHVLWYLIICTFGLILGIFMRFIAKKLNSHKR